MKKFWAILGMSLIVLIGLCIAAKLTGIIQLYVVPTASSEPNLKTGSHILASPLKKPKRLDLIVFVANPSVTESKELYVHRLCAIGGDTVEVKSGLLFVNGIHIDSALDHNQEYMIGKNELSKVEQLSNSNDEPWMNTSGDSATVYLSEHFVAANKIAARKVVRAPGVKDEYIIRQYNKDWNADYFGPIVVPKDCYFVMGDNRHNAMDSRYQGFIPVSSFRGTVLR